MTTTELPTHILGFPLKPPKEKGPVDAALTQAASFDPWDTIDDDQTLLSPEDFIAPDNPPPDSVWAIVPDSHEPLPWSRDISRGETTGEHNAFRHYVALGLNRTLRKVADDLDVPYSRVTSLAKKFDWNARATAWDTYQDEQYEKALLDRVKDMANRHATTFASALESLAVAFSPLANPAIIEEELNALPVNRRMQLAIQAAKAMPGLAAAERLALGMPTEIKSESSTTTIKYEANLDDLKGILQGLVEANAVEKVSSREKIEASEDGETVDAEIVD